MVVAECGDRVERGGFFCPTVDPATKSTWWWPDYTGTTNTSDTGTGFVYGLLSLLDADGEWFLDQPASTLSLRITGGVDPTNHVVEIKRRNWCVNVFGFDYITVRGLKTIGGAIRLSGTGNVLENTEAVHLSHYLVWSNGSSNNGGRAEGGGVVVSGTGNVVRGCTIHYTAGSGHPLRVAQDICSRATRSTTSTTPAPTLRHSRSLVRT